MTLWIKVDVDFFDHPKTARAGVPAAFLFLKMIAYCKRVAPDGRVPKVADLGKVQTRASLTALVAAGLLHDDGDCWLVHEYTTWQTASSELSAKRSAAGSKGAARRWHDKAPADNKPDGNGHATPMAIAIGKPIAESEPESESEEDLSLSAEQPTTDRARRETAQIREVFGHWVAAMGKDPGRPIGKTRAGKIRARLREGFSVDELKLAIDGCRASSWHMGDNPEGARYDEVGRIFNNTESVEKFMGRGRKAPANGVGQASIDDLFREAAASNAATAARMAP